MARKALITTLTSIAIGCAAIASTAPAQAGGYKPFPLKAFPSKPGPKVGWSHHPGPYGGGLLAAGVIGGLAVGALAASAAEAEECYTMRQRMVTEDGDILIRRVRVCE